MSRIVYVNGAYLPEEEGRVSIFDRGFRFADGVYEVSAMLRIAGQESLTVEEDPVTPEEVYRAEEAFITSATAFALPVVSIDGHRIGDGRPGPVTRRLRPLYIDAAIIGDRG